MWVELDIICDTFYVDWFINIKKSHWEGANIGLNNFNSQF